MLENIKNVKTHTGNGVTTVFPYDFLIDDDDYAEVTLLEIATGILTTLVLGDGDFSIDGIGVDEGGNVTYNPGTPLASTHKINIRRVVPLVQNMDINNQTGFLPEVLEDQLDLMVMQIQQVSEKADRAVVVEVGDTTDPATLIASLLAASATATTQAGIATTQAGIATTKASEAAAAVITVSPVEDQIDAAADTAFADADMLTARKDSDGSLIKRSWANVKSALAALHPVLTLLTTRGDMIYRSASTWVRLPKGTAGQVLTMGADDPAWAGGRHIGEIVFHSGTTVPALCLAPFGQNVSRTTYAAYFAEVGTTYGVGDGSTTFAMPDYRGRVIAGKDDMGGSSANRLTNQSGGLDGDVLSATGGAETHTLTTAQMPAHTHTVAAGNQTQDGDFYDSNANGPSRTMNTGSTGGDGAHNNVQPTAIANIAIFVGV
jgi:microcystin-dependent protein